MNPSHFISCFLASFFSPDFLFSLAHHCFFHAASSLYYSCPAKLSNLVSPKICFLSCNVATERSWKKSSLWTLSTLSSRSQPQIGPHRCLVVLCALLFLKPPPSLADDPAFQFMEIFKTIRWEVLQLPFLSSIIFFPHLHPVLPLPVLLNSVSWGIFLHDSVSWPYLKVFPLY